MKQLLLTGYDEPYAPLAELTVPLMEDLALRRGFDFRVVREPLIDVPFGIYWTGIIGTLKAFEEGYGLVLYLDVDQTITNPDAVPNFTNGFHASRDWGNDAVDDSQFSMAGFTATPDTKFIFKETLALEPEFRDKPFPAQWPLQHIYRTSPKANCKMSAKGNKRMNIHPRRVFNAVPNEVCPGNVPEPWEPGDFCCHLTMLPLPERVKLFHEIKRQAGI